MWNTIKLGFGSCLGILCVSVPLCHNNMSSHISESTEVGIISHQHLFQQIQSLDGSLNARFASKNGGVILNNT